MAKKKTGFRSKEELDKINGLLDLYKKKDPSEYPLICDNSCEFRKKGFCIDQNAVAPRYGEDCTVGRERA